MVTVTHKEGVCVDKFGQIEGQYCGYSYDCAPGLTCAGTSLCIRMSSLKTIGAYCDTGEGCGWNLTCNFYTYACEETLGL
jgi:hypothetical protein